MAAILAALALSPLSLYHYRAQVWWGRPVDVRVALVRRDGDWAAAKVTSPSPTGPQWLLVHRGKVVTWVAKTAAQFYCGDAPPGVIRQLVGGCETYGRHQDDVAIVGPTYRRRISRPVHGCVHPEVYVSRLDPSWSQIYGCAVSGATSYLHHGKLVGGDIDGPGCDWAPPGIIRSLHGFCLLAP